MERISIAVAAMAAVFVVAPATASADDWTCRSSAAIAQLAGATVAEPIAANRGNSPCAADAAGVSDINLTPIPVDERAAYARTNRAPGGRPAGEQGVTALAGADTTTIASADGNFVLTADAITAAAGASCLGATPIYGGTSTAATVRINGTPISLDEGLEVVGNGLNGAPLGGLIRVRFNENGFTGDDANRQHFRRAVHVTILDAVGTPLLDAVAAEARVGRSGDVCAARSQPPPGVTCPDGTSWDPASGFCVRLEVVPPTGNPQSPCPENTFQREDGSCVRAVFVNAIASPPGESTGGSRGGTATDAPLVPLGDVDPRRLGACASRRFGREDAMLGTKGADKMTGTNLSDRILTDDGADVVSGGRGGDCIRGENDNDHLDGSSGSDTVDGGDGRDLVAGGPGRDQLIGAGCNDRVIGGTDHDRLSGGEGRDFLQGGAGRNVLLGGKGNDFLTTGSGGDRAVGGPGNDSINAAKAGRATRISCGPGRDTVRVNENENRRRNLRGCERIFVIKRRR